MFLIICTPILAKLIGDIFEKYAPKLQNQIIDAVNNFYEKVIITTIVIIISIQNIKPKLNQEYYNENDYPIRAAAWIKANLDIENIKLFNEYNYGSYLIFENIPVMIDSRCDLYTPQYNTKTGKAEDGQDIFMDVQNVATGVDNYNDTFKKYGVTHIITYAESNLHKKLKLDANYEKIYPKTEEEKVDKSFVIYERLDVENE